MIRKIQTALSKISKPHTHEDEALMDVNDLPKVEQKIKAIMANVFRIDANEINEETTADDVAHWTSLEHVNFLVKLQNDFDIELTDSQIVEMLSYKTVVQNVTASIKEKEMSR